MKYVFLISLFLLYPYFLYSQSSDLEKYESLSITKYTTRDGLAQMQMDVIFEDSRGYKWIGTRQGLSRFDGNKFENFRINDGLPSNIITDIQEDLNGNIWIGTKEGFAKFDGQHWVTFPQYHKRTDEIIIDELGIIWILNQKEGTLYKFQNNIIANANIDYPQIKNLNIRGFYIKQKAKYVLILEQNNSYHLYKIEKDSLIKIKNSQNWIFVDGESEFEILMQHKTKKSSLFFSIFRNDKIQNTFTKSKYRYNHSYVKNSTLYTIGRDNEQTVLSKTNLEDFTTRYFYNLPINLSGELFIDNEETIWLGTDEGLVKIYNNPFTNFTSSEFQNVWSILQDNEGKHWFSSYTNGIQIIENKTLERFKPESTSLYYFYMRTIKRKSGTLVFPFGNGLLEVQDEELTWLDSCNTCLSQFVFEDIESNLLLSGSRKSVRLIDENGNKTIIEGKDQIHENKFIISIAQDKLGYYWFGSLQGLTRYDLTQLKPIEHYTLSEGNLPTRGIVSILKDKDGDLWLGSERGLLFYDYDANTFTKVADLKINSQINSMIELKEDYLMMGTVEGLFVLNISKYKTNKEIELYQYNERNGFMGIEPTKNGMYKDDDGIIWIPCQNHLVKLNPQKLDFEKERKPVQVQITQIDERQVFNDTILPLLNEKEVANFKWKVISSSAPKTPLFSYKLNNYHWSDWSERNEVKITNLNHGINTIQVRAKRDIYSPIISDIKAIHVKANLSFFQRYRYLFKYLVFAFSLVVLAFIFYKYKRDQQAKKDAKRRDELLRIYQLRSLEARMNPHFIFNSLSAVQKHIHLSDKELADSFLIMFSDMLRYFFETFTKERKVNAKTLYDEVKLRDEIEFLKMYVKLQQELYEDFKVNFKVDKNVNLDQPILPMVIQPFVENAITHGLINRENSNILNIEFKSKNGLVCIVEDNGVGIGIENLDISFEEFVLSNNNSQLLKERISMLRTIGLHIDINIKSKKNEGTTITIYFKKHTDGNHKNSPT